MSDKADFKPAVDHALQKFLHMSKEREVLKGKLHGGHLEQLKPHVTVPITNLMKHLSDKTFESKSMEWQSGHKSGGSVGMGGSIIMGGAIPKNAKEAYHWALNLTPQQLEMKREIASQLLGGVPSPMWGSLVSKEDKLEADPEEYEKVIDMPNVHSMARMIEADHGYSKGGGFWKAVKHIAKKASSLWSFGHNALGVANALKDSGLAEAVMSLPALSPYKGALDSAFQTMNAFDQTVNPMVETTMKLVNGDESERAKLKEIAMNAVENAAITYVPGSKEYIDTARKLKTAYDDFSGVQNMSVSSRRHRKQRAHDEIIEQPVPESGEIIQ